MGNSLSSSVSYFDEQTNKGIVLNLDISKRTDLGPRQRDNVNLVLTQDEVNERTRWETIRCQLEQSKLMTRGSTVWTQEQLLQRRVAAPVLNPQPEKVSTRSRPSEGRAGRMYPHRMVAWDEFPGLVSATKPTGKAASPRELPFILGLYDGHRKSDERSEELYLIAVALDGLRRIGDLLQQRTDGSKGCKGDPDFFFGTGSTPVLIGESKSTHNLPLPMQAREICTAYNAAREMMRREPENRTLAWSHIGHPVAQLSGYMALNKCRYGVLTSGTRSYFLMIKQDQNVGEDVLHISDAWFVGQADYLRAWVCAHNRGVNSQEGRLSEVPSGGWSDGTPPLKRKRDQDDDEHVHSTKSSRSQGGQKGGRGMVRASGGRKDGGRKSAASPGLVVTIALDTSIPEVDYEEIQFLDPIGYGRRGTVFAAKWKKETVALKQFDTWKGDGLDAFKREIVAYEHLKNAWGKLVPTPKFISEAYGVIFFGMQMAEQPADTTRRHEWDDVIDELENVYGFHHADLEGDARSGLHNRMIISGPDKSQPIVIDLEDYQLAQEFERPDKQPS